VGIGVSVGGGGFVAAGGIDVGVGGTGAAVGPHAVSATISNNANNADNFDERHMWLLSCECGSIDNDKVLHHSAPDPITCQSEGYYLPCASLYCIARKLADPIVGRRVDLSLPPIP
jgi:hypothetical protein